MFPNNRLSQNPVQGDFIKPPKTPLTDYEWGGINIRDTSQGLYHSLWYGECSGDSFSLTNYTNTLNGTLPNTATEFSFCFDNNMNYCIAYTSENNVSYLIFYDTKDQAYNTINIEGNNLIVSLDVGLNEFTDFNDIILSYIKNSALYFRLQRDRFQIEYKLRDNVEGLYNAGMMRSNRFGWECD